MKFYQYDKKFPKEGQFCFIKEKFGNNVELFSWPQPYYDHCGFQNHPNVVAWAAEPEHISINPVGWLSEYRGDEFPSKSCLCCVCEDGRRIVSRAYFDKKEQRFLGHPDVVAYMPIEQGR